MKGHFATHVEEGRDAGVQVRLPSVERGWKVAGPSRSPSLFKFLQVHGQKVKREMGTDWVSSFNPYSVY